MSTSLIENLVSFEHTLISHALDMSTPAPIQYPLIAQTTGTRIVSSIVADSWSGPSNFLKSRLYLAASFSD